MNVLLPSNLIELKHGPLYICRRLLHLLLEVSHVSGRLSLVPMAEQTRDLVKHRSLLSEAISCLGNSRVHLLAVLVSYGIRQSDLCPRIGEGTNIIAAGVRRRKWCITLSNLLLNNIVHMRVFEKILMLAILRIDSFTHAFKCHFWLATLFTPYRNEFG